MKQTPLKRRRRTRQVIDRQAAEAWARGARTKPCVICGAKAGVQGHHVITQQQLRIAASEHNLDFERIRWDRRNRLPLCSRHHAAHHSAHHRIPLSVLEDACPKVFQFARELGLEWWLERTYGDRETAA